MTWETPFFQLILSLLFLEKTTEISSTPCFSWGTTLAMMLQSWERAGSNQKIALPVGEGGNQGPKIPKAGQATKKNQRET